MAEASATGEKDQTDSTRDKEEEEEELTERQINEIKIAFAFFDKDGNGYISSKELGAVLRSLGQNPTDVELHAMINEADLDGNGIINLPEFMEMMIRRLKEEDRTEAIKEAFRAFDTEGKGSFSVEELRYVLSNIQDFVTIPKHTINEIVEEADITGSGTINYEEFSLLFET